MNERPTFARATAAYDDAHEEAVVEAILEAIAATSVVSDVDAMVIRTGEAASALLSCLALVLALSPAATRSPTQLRKTVDELGKRLRRRIANAEPSAEAFRARVFTSTTTRGTA